MILNARQIYLKKKNSGKASPLIILLAMEDVTEMMVVAKTLASHARELETDLSERTFRLETNIERLEKIISELKTSK
jgi:hypothetical protein